jgi:hypothetical protein
MKRSNALGILLSKMPAIAAMVAAIWALDDTVLSRDQIEALLLQLPSKEEIALVRAETKAAGGAAAVRLACCIYVADASHLRHICAKHVSLTRHAAGGTSRSASFSRSPRFPISGSALRSGSCATRRPNGLQRSELPVPSSHTRADRCGGRQRSAPLWLRRCLSEIS